MIFGLLQRPRLLQACLRECTEPTNPLNRISKWVDRYTQCAHCHGCLYNCFDFDAAYNGVYSPTTPEAQAAARADPNWTGPTALHVGGHGNYNKRVSEFAQIQLDALVDGFGSVERIPHAQISLAIQEIKKNAREILTDSGGVLE